jgi:hypothetical protein
MTGKISEIGMKGLRSNLQQAQTARAFQLLQNNRDFDKRANGVNSQLEGGLHGDLDAKQELKQEKHYHRTFLNMAAAGYLATEIAAFTGFNVTTVSNCLKQPWARQFLIKEAKKTVSDEIRELLEKEAIPSLKLLVEVRDNEAAKNADRISAGSQLLDRFLGKPTQPISNNVKPPSEMSDEELRTQVQRELTASQPN